MRQQSMHIWEGGGNRKKNKRRMRERNRKREIRLKRNFKPVGEAEVK